jgi:hypothetical protein
LTNFHQMNFKGSLASNGGFQTTLVFCWNISCASASFLYTRKPVFRWSKKPFIPSCQSLHRNYNNIIIHITFSVWATRINGGIITYQSVKAETYASSIS